MELKPYEKYFLDIKEAAEYYGIGLKKVRRLAEDGMGSYAMTVRVPMIFSSRSWNW